MNSDSYRNRFQKTMSHLSVNHLLGIKSLTKNDIELILSTAQNFKEVINRPIKKVPSLRDITIANLFFENSTRTRLSFELAQKRLSADTINFSCLLTCYLVFLKHSFTILSITAFYMFVISIKLKDWERQIYCLSGLLIFLSDWEVFSF